MIAQAIVLFAVGAGSFTAGCVVVWMQGTAVRVDRDLHEQDAHKNGDALTWLERRDDRRQAALRYLARLPQHRRVRVLSRYCRRIQQETTA